MYKYNGSSKTKELKVIGLSIELGNDQKSNYKKMVNLWERFELNINPSETVTKKNKAQYGISYDSDEDQTYKYLASVEVSDLQGHHEGLITKVIPAQKYLHFTHMGTMEYLVDSIEAIYQEWLPESDLEIAADQLSKLNYIEKYDTRFHWTQTDSEIDILIPVSLFSDREQV